MARPLRYGEPDWDSPPHSNPAHLDIMQRPLSNKSYEELRFDQLVASGSVDNTAPYINSIGRRTGTKGFRDQDILTIMVSEGDHSATFKIHENIITSSSKFVEAAMRHQFIEKYSRVVRLPAEDPDTFERYAQWLYCGVLNISDHDLLLKMYKLGERLLDDRFQESCLKALRGSFMPFTIDQILYILNNMLDHDQLRKYCLSELGSGIISGKYNFNKAQLEVLSDHMAELMQAVMETVSTKSGFQHKAADATAPSQTLAASTSNQPQGIRPSHYTPNIGWHFTNPPAGSQSTTISPSTGPQPPPATTSLFGPGPTRSTGLFDMPRVYAPAAPSSIFSQAPTSSIGLFGATPSSTPYPQPVISTASRAPQATSNWDAWSGTASSPSASTFGPPATSGTSGNLSSTSAPFAPVTGPLKGDGQLPQTTSLFGGEAPSSILGQPKSGGLLARQSSKTTTDPPHPSYTFPDRSTAPNSRFAAFGDSLFNNWDSHLSSKPAVFGASPRDEGSAKVLPGKSSVAPIRHLTKTPLELWLGKDVPAKVSKMSTARRTSLETPGDTKTPDTGTRLSDQSSTSTKPTHLSQVANLNIVQGKGKEKALDWDGKASEERDSDVIYTPASSTASDRPNAIVVAEESTYGSAPLDKKLAYDDASPQTVAASSAAPIDYQAQLALLEAQNRKRLLIARNEADSDVASERVEAEGSQGQTTNPTVTGSSSSSIKYDWTSNAVYMSNKQNQGAAGFEKYAQTAQSGFAQMGGRHASTSRPAGSSFGDGSSFP